MHVGEVAPARSEELFGDGLTALDRAAELYLEIGSIDFYTCLLTTADALRHIEEDASAEGVYARITAELQGSAWAEPDALARHAVFLRARAEMGLADIAFRREDAPGARDRMEAAVALLLASAGDDPVALTLVDAIADELAEKLHDPARAAEIRAAARPP
jgi:hypothetical protein